MDTLRNTPGFLGTNGSLLADFTLAIEILFFLVLCAGVAVQLMANRGRPHLYKWHDRLQAPVVVLNLLLIIFIMIPVFLLVAGRGSGGGSWVPLTHGMLGLLAEGVAIYCLLAGFKILPRKIGVLRYWMWTAFSLWTVTILFGIGVYIGFYGGSPADPPVVGEHDADLIAEHGETELASSGEVVEEHAAEIVEPAPVEEHAEALIEPEPTQPVEEHAEELIEPEPTAEVAAADIPVRAGIVRFSDDQIHSDKVTIALNDVPPAAAGFAYEAWLQAENQPPLSLGIVAVNNGQINHQYIDPEGRRLIDLFDGAFISLEPANDSDPAASATVIFSGQVAPAAMAHVRHVVSAMPASPDGDGFALNALAEAGLILQQVEVQQQSVASNNLADLHIHAETTLNIIEGANSPDYGDRDGDGEAFNPGDGFGLLRFGDAGGYLISAAEHANLAAAATGASDEVQLHAEHVNIAATNALDWAGQIVALEQQIVAVDNPADAAPLVTQVAELAEALLEGVDANGDGQIAPVPGEGGIRTMYQHGQLMGSIELFAAEVGAIGPAELVDEHDEAPLEPPTATPAPVATATPLPAPTATPTVELISEHDGE